MKKANDTEQVGRLFDRLITGLEEAKQPVPLFGADAKVAEQVVNSSLRSIVGACG